MIILVMFLLLSVTMHAMDADKESGALRSKRWFNELGPHMQRLCHRIPASKEVDPENDCYMINTALRYIALNMNYRSVDGVDDASGEVISKRVARLCVRDRLGEFFINKEINSILALRRRILWGRIYHCALRLSPAASYSCSDEYAKKWGL